MNAAKPSSGLLPAASTLALVGLLAERNRAVPAEELIRDFAISAPASWVRARNTVAKLVGYDIFAGGGGATVMLSAPVQDNWRLRIADCVERELCSLLTATGSWSCVRSDDATGGLLIDSMTMPPTKDGLAMWVSDFGIVTRTAIQNRFWIVADERRDSFLRSIREHNEHRPRRPKTMEDLAAQLALDAENGDAAEKWVLEFERLRLRGHPLLDQIRRISLNDVGAGYDIASFAGSTSLEHDLFIEVKSHGAQKVFHWTRNEIATAREFGESYALYLVDRTRSDVPGYVPHIITGPTPEMFHGPESGWSVEATSFEHTAIATRDR